MGVSAEVIETHTPGLTLKINLNGSDEERFRFMNNEINDDSDCSQCMQQVLEIAHDAVMLISKHKRKVY